MIMNNHFRILEYSRKYEKELSSLYYQSYGRKKPISYFRYRLKKNHIGKPIAYVMKFKNKLVGFYALSPIYIIVDKKKYLGAYSFLTMTHKEFSGQGIFSQLATKAFKKAKEKKYNFIMGFANNNSFALFVKKFDFVELEPINYIKLKISANNNSTRKITKSVSKKNPVFFTNMYTKNFSVYIQRNFEYFDYRINQNSQNYLVFQSNDMFCIFKKYDNELQLLEFSSKNSQESLSQILSLSYFLMKKSNSDYVTSWIPEKHILNKFSYSKKLKPYSHFIIKSLNPKITRKITKISNWHYTMSDADVF